MMDLNKPKNNTLGYSKNININLFPKDYLSITGLDYKDFENKKVLSIGGGFGFLEADLAQKTNAKVEIVDPIFGDIDKLDDLVVKNISWINTHKLELVETVSQSELLEILDSNGPVHYQREIEKIEQNNKNMNTNMKMDKFIKHLESWKNGEFNDILIFNSSFGQNIENVENNSQNFVFINNTLSYLKGFEKDVLSEADRVLSDGGKIIIIDYKDKLKHLQECFKKHIVSIQSGYFCIIFGKGEFKQLI